MTIVSECDQLVARYERKREQGLVDVKFYLRNTDEALKEEVCAEVNRLDEALEQNNYIPLVFDDIRED